MRPIDADALKERFSNMYRDDYEEWIKSIIDKAPTLPVEYMRGYEAAEREYKRPIGKWISNCADYYDGLSCSVCGEMLPCSDEYHYDANYCPHCGARMEVNNNG